LQQLGFGNTQVRGELAAVTRLGRLQVLGLGQTGPRRTRCGRCVGEWQVLELWNAQAQGELAADIGLWQLQQFGEENTLVRGELAAVAGLEQL